MQHINRAKISYLIGNWIHKMNDISNCFLEIQMKLWKLSYDTVLRWEHSVNSFDWPEESYHLTHTRRSNKYDFINRRYQCFSRFSKPVRKGPIKVHRCKHGHGTEGRVRQKAIPCYHLNKVLWSSYCSKGWLDDPEVKASRPTCMFRYLQSEAHGFLSYWKT